MSKAMTISIQGKSWTLSLLFFTLSIPLLGQQGDDDDDPLTEQIVTVGEWKPQIEAVEKLKVEPGMIDTTPPKPDLDYSRIPVHYDTDFHVEPIEAARLRVKEPIDRLRKGYVRLGIGTFTTPIGDAYFSSDRDRDHQYSAHIFHRSSEGGVKNNDFADWSRNGVDLRGKWPRRNGSFQAELGYERNVRHHYGLPVDADTMDVIQNEDIRQRFHDIRGELNWERQGTDSNETDHDIGLEVHHFSSLEDASEFHADLDGRFDRFVEDEHLRLDAGVDHNSYQHQGRSESQEGGSIDNTLIRLNPNIVSQGDGWRVKVGLELVSDIGNSASFHFYPMADAHYVLFDGIFIPYAGIRGGKERNNLRTLAGMNPHIHSSQKLLNTNERYELYGGIRGSLSSTLNFDLRASKRSFEDLPLLVNDTNFSRMNRFDVIYDSGEKIELRGDLSYYQGERLKLNLSGVYRDFRSLDETAAWHRSIFEASLQGWYDIQDKFTVSAKVRYNAPRKAKALEEIPGETDRRIGDAYIIELDQYVDANLGIEYRYTKDISAFLNFNNILGSRYQRWYRYPVQGFQVLGGLTYSL